MSAVWSSGAPARELVLFLHAVGGTPAQWAPQVSALSGLGYATCAVDLTLPAEQVSVEAMAEVVLTALRAQGYARAHLVGLSMGGVVALEVYQRAPERVRSLTLANTWAHLADGADRVAWVRGEVARTAPARIARWWRG